MSSRTPKADAVNALGVSDGTEARGTIVEHGGSHFAFSVTGDLVGKFETQLAAMRALPPSKTVTSRRRRRPGSPDTLTSASFTTVLLL